MKYKIPILLAAALLTVAAKAQSTDGTSTGQSTAANADSLTNNSNDNFEINSLLNYLLGIDDTKNKYAVKDGVVTYDGKPVKKADAATFQYVGGNYAADKHHAYYKGRIISDAWGIGQFKYMGNGTATDGVHYYSNGLPVDRD